MDGRTHEAPVRPWQWLGFGLNRRAAGRITVLALTALYFGARGAWGDLDLVAFLDSMAVSLIFLFLEAWLDGRQAAIPGRRLARATAQRLLAPIVYLVLRIALGSLDPTWLVDTLIMGTWLLGLEAHIDRQNTIAM